MAATAVEAFFELRRAAWCGSAVPADPDIGYELNQRVTRVLAKRLQVTRIRLLARSGYGAAVH